MKNISDWNLVEDKKPNVLSWVLVTNVIYNWFDIAVYNKDQGYWWNGDMEINPTHWIELPIFDKTDNE